MLELADTTLYHVLAESATTPIMQSTTDLIQQIASGLSHLHLFKVAHRDLKPQNILMIKPQSGLQSEKLYYQAKISDFGVAREQLQTFTQTYNAQGTIIYMAPECRALLHSTAGKLAESIDWFAADMWSFGLICSEIFLKSTLGDIFYTNNTLSQEISEGNAAPLIALSREAGDSSQMIEGVARCLVKSPGDRFNINTFVANSLPQDACMETARSTLRSTPSATAQSQRGNEHFSTARSP